MKWSLKLGRIAGIKVYVHATFWILVLWIVASQYMAHQTVAATASAVGFVFLIFLIIVLHELGHALAARRYGIETEDITLLPIGGLARLKRIPEDPVQELVVAFAGPLVNFVIAASIFVGMLVANGKAGIWGAISSPTDFMAELLWVNVFLAFFNLLPAFPMDGGRVLRAVLALRLTRERATEIAVGVGHLMALIFGAIGLSGQPFLVFIAFFIWIGADAELQQVRQHSFLKGITAAEVMASDFKTIGADTELGELGKRVVPGFQSDYPVFEGERLVGFIGLDDIVRGVAEKGPQATAGTYAHTDFNTAAPDDMIESVLTDWTPGGGPVVAVFEAGKLVGMVTPVNVGEFMMLRSAMQHTGQGK